jgi:hypothetical protein
LAAWDFTVLGQSFVDQEFDTYYLVDGEYAYGSYGKNPWVSEPDDEVGDDYYGFQHYFQTVLVKGPNKIPLFGDCNYTGGFPHIYDQPAETRVHGPVDMDGEINRWNLDRHQLSINLLFLDYSVRKVGLKQLWTLRWNRESGWGNLNVVPDWGKVEEWPTWMRNARNYE